MKQHMNRQLATHGRRIICHWVEFWTFKSARATARGIDNHYESLSALWGKQRHFLSLMELLRSLGLTGVLSFCGDQCRGYRMASICPGTVCPDALVASRCHGEIGDLYTAISRPRSGISAGTFTPPPYRPPRCQSGSLVVKLCVAQAQERTAGPEVVQRMRRACSIQFANLQDSTTPRCSECPSKENVVLQKERAVLIEPWPELPKHRIFRMPINMLTNLRPILG